MRTGDLWPHERKINEQRKVFYWFFPNVDNCFYPNMVLAEYKWISLFYINYTIIGCRVFWSFWHGCSAVGRFRVYEATTIGGY